MIDTLRSKDFLINSMLEDSEQVKILIAAEAIITEIKNNGLTHYQAEQALDYVKVAIREFEV